MTPTAFALAVAAAALHASWNLAVKASGDRLVTTCAQATFGALVFAPFLVVGGLPRGAVDSAVVSSLVHLAYYLCLVTAYRRTDLSVAYPVARGSAPMLVAIGGTVIVHDDLSLQAWIGIAIVSGALLALASQLRDRHHLLWPLITGVVISTYTLIDASAVRDSDERMAYVGLLFVLTAVWFLPLVLVRRGVPAFTAVVRANGSRLVGAGGASVVSYALVLLAATHGAVGPVAAVRETSVVFAVVGGRFLLREEVRLQRLLSAAGVAAGAVVLAFS